MSNQPPFSFSSAKEIATPQGTMVFRRLVSLHQTGAVISSKTSPAGPIPVRIQSSCLFSGTLLIVDCDCASQLRHSLSYLASQGGHLIYLYGERNVELANRIKAMSLRQKGPISAATAFTALGAQPDTRDYTLAAQIVAELVNGDAIELLTNNPHKSLAVKQAGIRVAKNVRLVVPKNQQKKEISREMMNTLGYLSAGSFDNHNDPTRLD